MKKRNPKVWKRNPEVWKEYWQVWKKTPEVWKEYWQVWAILFSKTLSKIAVYKMILIKNSYYSNESKILIFVNFSLCVIYFVNNIALRYLLRKNNQVIIFSFPKRSWLFWDIMYFYKKQNHNKNKS